jgi:hypothetical protein
VLFAVLLGLCPLAVPAASTTIAASNPGPIDGTGRELAFDLSGVTAPITAATLELDLDYSRVRELDLRLVDASGVVELPLAAFVGTTGAAGVRGRYRFSDSATSTWLQAETQAAGGILSAGYATRVFQRGLDGGVCLNLIGRYLEFDIDRSQPLRLLIARAPGSLGTGRVDAARLRIEDARPDGLFESGIEEPPGVIPACRRAMLDVVVNGGGERTADSPLTILHYGAAGLDWYSRQASPAFQSGPITFGDSTSQPYVGRFGGRSRQNLGFWDAGTGALNFTTGAGARALYLDGDWSTTEHYPIPGDYDGDGITDLAMVFLGDFLGQPRWYARIRFSRSDDTRDFLVDPRVPAGSSFSSPQIAFGPGQDSNLDGRDELTQYARLSPSSQAMSMVIWLIDPDRPFPEGFATSPWGQVGDVMVLGRWVDAPGPGNRLSQMVVRGTPAGLDWYLFGNTTPTRWGLPGDQPISINVDDDVRHDIAVFRPSTRRIHAIRSSDGLQVEIDTHAPTAGVSGLVIALGYLQGTLALPTF